MTHPELVDALLGSRRIVSLVGAGGKKTTLYALAEALSERVALTSTSHMYPYARSTVERVVTVLPDGTPPAAEGRVVAYGGLTDTTKRLGGLSERQIEQLAALPDYARILIKADGARARWVKAPAPYEPIIPACTERVLYLVSGAVIGCALDERIAHRPERVAAVTGARIGELLTSVHLARLLASPAGALQGLGAAELVPVINMVDDAERLTSARHAARAALAATTRFDRVVLAAMRESRIVDVVTRAA
jgi:probable selenium-dependent hydroxylase accessory protein YqeC